MTTKITNGWITLTEQRNGITVQRAFAGLDTRSTPPDENGDSSVQYCMLYFHERELYPNNVPIKTELKSYQLLDLDYTEVMIENVLMSMEPMAVLTTFVNSMGYEKIIEPSRLTLADTSILTLTSENAYPLHRDTRPTTAVVIEEVAPVIPEPESPTPPQLPNNLS